MSDKHFTFVVVLDGHGKDVDAAWDDAVEGFEADPGVTPGPVTTAAILDLVRNEGGVPTGYLVEED